MLKKMSFCEFRRILVKETLLYKKSISAHKRLYLLYMSSQILVQF